MKDWISWPRSSVTILAGHPAILTVSAKRVSTSCTRPRSRANPQFNADTLAQALTPAGIVYRHLAALGGLRGRRKDAAPSSNTPWRSNAFRNYADYAETALFRSGLDQLIELARENCSAIMCAEAVWWRCHRRIIADYLIAARESVFHILGPGKIQPARLTPAARDTVTGTLVYPKQQPSFL